MPCCRDGGYQVLACRKAVRVGKGKRSIAGKGKRRALGSRFLGSYSCRSISIPYLQDLWVAVYWPGAGIAALRAFSGCAGTSITWGQMSADYLIQMTKYTSHSILHHSPCESSCSAIWQLLADNFWETDFKL